VIGGGSRGGLALPIDQGQRPYWHASIWSLTPAVANAATPCSGQVCLFDSHGRFVGAYEDVTTSFQSLNTARTTSVVNGFSDNAVYFKHANGATSCIQPQREASVLIPDYGHAVGLMIRPGGNCYPGGQIQ
jgi:hypothetical protein